MKARFSVLAGLSFAAPGLAGAQVAPPPPPLVQDPQAGATPRVTPVSPSPLTPPAPLTPPPPLASPVTLQPQSAAPVPSVPQGFQLPQPVGDPMRIDPATDPVLVLTRAEASPAAFRTVIAAAVARNPAIDEAAAQVGEAQAVRDEAAARRLPVADAAFSTFNILSRRFAGDPRNILERSRPNGRTDATLRVQQPVFDFGITSQRIAAGEARIRAAAAASEDTGTQIALSAVGAWYNVFGYRALTDLAEAFAASQRSLRTAVEERIERGAAATGDLAQVDSAIASADAQVADFRRARANAEAQYLATTGQAAPPVLTRAPAPEPRWQNGAAPDVATLAPVRSARAAADAAARDVRAARGDALPSVTAGLDAGRYGVFETAGDYDIRGNVTLSLRIGGGGEQRIAQAAARADGAEARWRRTRDEVTRDVAVARSDVDALAEARAAGERNYLASRGARDVLIERFRVARGTIFDVLTAQNNYFGVAARYIQTVTELDTARYVLLARSGRLLPALGIVPDRLKGLP